MAYASYIGIDQILEGFEDKAETPYFTLWVGKACTEFNKVNDMDVAKEKIIKQVKRFADNGMNECFIIALHPKLPAKGSNWEISDTQGGKAILIYCQAKKAHTVSGDMNFQVLEKLNSLESKISALEADEVEEDEAEAISGTDKALEQINGIINSPVAIAILGLLNKFIPVNSNPTALASPSQDDLSAIIATLFQKGVTVEHLRKLSEYPKERITMLLSML